MEQAQLTHEITEYGNLLITANDTAKQELKEAFQNGGRLLAWALFAKLLHEKFWLFEASDLGYLSEAPLLVPFDDIYPNDDGDWIFHDEENANQYFYGDYMIKFFFEELFTKGAVLFSKI